MKKIFKIVLILLLLVAVSKFVASKMGMDGSNLPSADELMRAADTMNKDLPKYLGNGTTLTEVQAIDGGLAYYYELDDRSGVAVNTQDITKYRSTVVDFFCSGAQGELLKRGLIYVVHSKITHGLVNINDTNTITAAECN